MTYQLFQLPKAQAFASGRVAPGAKLSFYLTGTSTPTPVYTTSALTTTHTQPVTADSAGVFPAIYLDPTISYKATYQEFDDSLLYTVDPANDQLLSRTVVGAYLYPRTAAEIAAGVTPENYYFPPGDVRRYGTITGSAGADTAVVQASINQSFQTATDAAPWFIPESVVCSVQTSGSTVSPVGSALSITGTCVGIIDGELRGNNNCNIINITADDVAIRGTGKINGYGTFHQSGANNGACIKNTGSRCKIDGLAVEDPPQYGIFFTSAAAVGGEILNVKVIGGPTAFSGNQHYGVEVEGPFRGIRIMGIQIIPNAAGTGRCVQGLGSGTNGGVPWDANVSGIDAQQMWDHGTYWYCRGGTFSNVNASRTGGSGIRVVGDAACSGLASDNCAGGGIDFLNTGGGSLAGFDIAEYQSIGLSIELLDTPTDDAISNVSVSGGTIKGKASTSTVRSAIRILSTYSGTGTNQSNVSVADINIKNAAQSSTAEAAVRLEVTTGKSLSRIKIDNLTIDTTGYVGIEMAGGGSLVDCEITNNIVCNPGSYVSATGSDTHGIRLQSSTTMTRGRVSGNRCIDNRGGSAKMETAYSVAGTQSYVEFRHNDAFGYTSAFGSFLQDGDYTAGSTTPSVRNRDNLYIANSSATTITNFTDGQERQEIQLTFADANTTINRTNAILVGGVNYTSSVGSSLRLMLRNGVWREIGRTAAAS